MNTETQLKAVAFDLDGTLFNTEVVYDMVGETVLQRRGHEIRPAVIAQMMGRPSHVALQFMIEAYGLVDTIKDLETECEEIFIELLPGRANLMPGALNMLNYVESLRLPKAITTSSQPQLVSPLLEMVGITERFEFTLTSTDVTRHKPHPQIYQKAAKLFGIETHELLVFEDSQVGCASAVAAGACTVAVPSKYKGEQDYSGAHLIANGLEDPQIAKLIGSAT